MNISCYAFGSIFNKASDGSEEFGRIASDWFEFRHGDSSIDFRASFDSVFNKWYEQTLSKMEADEFAQYIQNLTSDSDSSIVACQFITSTYMRRKYPELIKSEEIVDEQEGDAATQWASSVCGEPKFDY